MKIFKFKFEDKSLEWCLEELSLNRITLLVGASGVGKTQILRSLLRLKEITEGTSINGVAWSIEFETLSKQKYIWQGEFENKGGLISLDSEDDNEEDKKNKPKIIFEKLFLDDNLIVDRTSSKIVFNGQPTTIKLSKQESIIHILKEEDDITPVSKAFSNIYLSGTLEKTMLLEHYKKDLGFLRVGEMLKKFRTLKDIQESRLGIDLKLFLLYKSDKKYFDRIKQRFIEVFSSIEDIKIEPMPIQDIENKQMPIYYKDMPIIQVKEKGVNKWVEERYISSGMFRTLMQISELYLCAEGTIFLIDEFENSLGINCINEITHDILASRRQLQFILTSHHPYIIDAISFNNWKLVTRNAGITKTHNIDKFNIGSSKHSAFMQLLQLEEYQTGQEQL
jgi:predicted ATPase